MIMMAQEQKEDRRVLPFPSEKNDYLADYVLPVLQSYKRLTGKDLVNPLSPPREQARQAFMAEFAIVSHGLEDSPVFWYANKAALEAFGYSWEEFIKLESKLSASEQNRQGRAAMLACVSTKGFINDYCGERVRKDGSTFEIEEGTVWNVVTDDGLPVGQAAAWGMNI